MTPTVAGAKPLNESEGYLYRGIADQSFKRTFQLAEYMKVMSAKLENGLLWIELKREVPEAMSRPRSASSCRRRELCRSRPQLDRGNAAATGRT